MFLRTISFLLLSAFIIQFSYSQNGTHGIKVITQCKKNIVTIRWAPTDPFVWQLGIKYGYVIERFNILEDGKLNDNLKEHPKLLSANPILPYSEAAFEELYKQEEMAGVVQEMIYGKEFHNNNSENPAAILKKSKELENRFGMALLACDLSPKVAIAAGLLWMDKSPIKGARYGYRIKLAHIPQGVTVEEGVAVVDVVEEKPLPPVVEVKAKFDDQKCTLSWPEYLFKGIYTAYIIERSQDKKVFTPLTEVPYIHMRKKGEMENSYFVDSLPNNEEIFYYRIKGVSPFGETGPPSTVLSGKGKTALEGIVYIDSSKIINNQKIFIAWTLPEEFKILMKGYYVTRAAKAEGPYKDIHTNILPASQLSFVDEKPNTYNYYKIKYYANDREEAYYTFPYLAQLYDSIPPASPSGIIGAIDSLGVATIKWQQGNEEDLLGYRVFRANALHEEFVEATRAILKRPVFVDTVNIQTLTKEVYYQVVAVDRHFNPSEYSAPLKLKRPDKIPPVPPVFTKVQMSQGIIELQWINSSSKDVKEYRLFRKKVNENTFGKLIDWPFDKAPRTYLDSTTEAGNAYQYSLQVLDSAGNMESAISKEIYFETGVRKPVSNVKSTVDRAKNRITLEWEYDNQKISKVLIYKAKNDGPTALFKTLPGNVFLFEDRDLTINSQYTYKIKMVLEGGVHTILSEAIQVKY